MTLRIETKFEMANSWLKEHAEHAPFCQSFDWEEILSREGKNVERLTVFDDSEPIAMALVEYHQLPFGWKYAFCPKGPVIKRNMENEIWDGILGSLAEYLRAKGCIFARFEPVSDMKKPHSAFIIRHSIDVNPRATMILNLKKSPDDILSLMHQKTRYNINLALKKDLRVSDVKDADLFMTLMRETGERDKFRLHEDRHYHEIIFSSGSYQLTVFYGQRPIATAVFVGFGDTFTYVFGASSYEHRALMAPYLIQWEGIKLGQRYGYSHYDFFGVAPKQPSARGDQPADDYNYNPRHQYAGVTRFKQGFGGEYHEDPGTFDLIISPWRYKVYGWLRGMRRLF